MNLEETLKKLKDYPPINLTPEESQRIKDEIIKAIRSKPLPTFMDFKHWYKSRTIRIAIVQAVIGIVVAFQATYPEMQAAGAIAIFKALLDIGLRFDTTEPILK